MSINGNWQRRPLGDVARIEAKQVDPRDAEFSKLPHVNGENIVSRALRLINVRSAAEDGMESGKYLFDPGDVLYSKLRPNLCKVAVVDFRGVCSADMYPIKTDAAVLDPQFLSWLLLSEEFTAYAIEQSRRARMPKLNREQLFSWQIPLPPMKEQKRIVAILVKKIAEAARAKAAIEAQLIASKNLPNAIYRAAFLGIEPLSVKTISSTAPPGWKWHKLTDLARLESGHTPSRNHPEWWGGDVPWLALTDIRALDGKVAQATAEYINEAGLANSSARLLPVNTVVLSRTASVGFVAIMGRPMATSQDFVNWICGPDLVPLFLLHLLRASKRLILANASGAIHKTVYMNIVQEFFVCIPPREQQMLILNQLSPQIASAAKLLAGLQEQAADMAMMPAAILRSAFSGEL